MRAIIAAAVLAVAGTGASAAVYEVDFTAEVTSIDDTFPGDYAVGDREDASLSFETDTFTTISCSIFTTCDGGSSASYELGENQELLSFSTPADIFATPVAVDFVAATGYTNTEIDIPGSDSRSGQFLRFAVSDVETRIDGIVQNPEISEVPLPASAPLLALGIGGFAWMRRRTA